jgi:cyclic beta-1,2-glucan synthetase
VAVGGSHGAPLNRARYDEDRQRVSEGYGILQPRVAVSLPGTNRSRYARLYGSEPGIDPYTRAVSDVYQDLFQEGSFIGKGIYEVDAFERALNGRFPENRILSHDLLEGCYARAGLLSDVQLYEEYPSRYSADVSRRYRWIRGDWHIARWLLPGVPGPGHTFRRIRSRGCPDGRSSTTCAAVSCPRR